MDKNKGQFGQCELLAETQWDDPRLMQKYEGADYYEQIVCQNGPNSKHFVSLTHTESFIDVGATKQAESAHEDRSNSNKLNFLKDLTQNLRTYMKNTKEQ
jgi:hypothetical protein